MDCGYIYVDCRVYKLSTHLFVQEEKEYYLVVVCCLKELKQGKIDWNYNYLKVFTVYECAGSSITNF